MLFFLSIKSWYRIEFIVYLKVPVNEKIQLYKYLFVLITVIQIPNFGFTTLDQQKFSINT